MKYLISALLILTGCSGHAFVSNEQADHGGSHQTDASAAIDSGAGIATDGSEPTTLDGSHGSTGTDAAIGQSDGHMPLGSNADAQASDSDVSVPPTPATDSGTADASAPSVADSGSDCTPVTMDRTGWIASAFSVSTAIPGPAANAIDDLIASRWSSGVTQGSQSPEWFQIDLGQSRAISSLTLYSSTASDQATSLTVTVSDVDLNLAATPQASSAATGNTVTVELPNVTGRYVLLQQTGQSTSWWSINDLNATGCAP